VTGDELRATYDAVLVATGAQLQRDLNLPGADLAGVIPAMRYLVGRNRAVAGRPVAGDRSSAAEKHVVVLGGGDTSADCLGCALREGARTVTEIAHGPTPPAQRTPLRTWPDWPFLLRTYAAHQEGGTREWQCETTHLTGEEGTVRELHGRRLAFDGFDGVGARPDPRPTGEHVTLPADLVLVAVGFTGVEDDPLYGQLGLHLRAGTVSAGAGGETGIAGVHAAGDCVRGADLIVTAIAEGRAAAQAIHARMCAEAAEAVA
jgi:glutamate synthase (NADPH/NADH) small chain